jgi:predicted O-methyltransferase YrrM
LTIEACGTDVVAGKAKPMLEQIERSLGTSVERYCSGIYAKRPPWITGSLSLEGARFLFRSALQARASTAAEIGTASGLSAAMLCHALELASRAGAVDPGFRVVSYDISPFFYAEPSKRVGEAARELLPPSLLMHIDFRNPAAAADLRDDFGPDELGLLFIDGNHQHPWPTLDLLTVLDCLSEGAVVVFDDINLPLLHPENEDWGAKYLFDSLNLEKELARADPGEEFPCMGSITIPGDKTILRATLLDILFDHPWQARIDEEYLSRIGIDMRDQTAD